MRGLFIIYYLFSKLFTVIECLQNGVGVTDVIIVLNYRGFTFSKPM